MRRRGLILAGALLLLSAGPAAATPQGDPVRFWSVSKVEQGVGELPVQDGAQLGDRLQKQVRVGGPLVFNLPLHAPFWQTLPRDEAFGALFSSATGATYSVMAQAPPPNPMRVGAVKGTVTHLDEYQAYEKRTDDASLRITLSDLLLQTIDDNNRAGAFECPPTGPCEPVRTVVRFHARAYAASAGGDFFDSGGVAFLVGHQHSWRPGAATSAEAPRPLWGEEDFDVDGDADESGTGAAGVMGLNRSRRVKVPLGSVRPGELFAVHVSLEAEAVDDAGGESAAQAFIQDPIHPGPPLLAAHGLRPRGNPKFKEPKLEAPAPARCPSGTSPKAGALQLSAPEFAVDESSGSPMVLVTRTGGTRGSASGVVSTSGVSASSDSDFKDTSTRVRFANGDDSPRLVEIPIREDDQVEAPENLTATLGHARCAKRGVQRDATVTINDDDAGPPPPPDGFTIGGSVDGLAGTGLVLTDNGTDVAIAGNGSFTFPGTRAGGVGYDVRIEAQPRSPDQDCAVEHGTGTVSANVTDIAVHCTTPTPPSGLDPTFGPDGRVSTPVGAEGEGEAVVIQGDGDIVTAGRTTTPTGMDFALTRHDPSGQPDPTFGGDGIVSTDLGSSDDQAFDAALLPGGDTVAVGRTLGTGPVNLDVALVSYRPDGTPDPAFGTGGVVKTDVLGSGDQANAVAVQPDGKIVVAGFATSGGTTLPDGDFLLARYDADGTPDSTFGGDGIVTTDLGTPADDVRALAIRPDGEIVAAGTANEDVALARYTAAGDLDTTFGDDGTRISDFGSDDVANGLALTPSGQILIAGFTLGTGGNRDFLLARYSSGGGLDSAFGDAGKVITDVGGGDDFAENLLVDPSGRPVLVGRATSSTILDMALVRYRPDGTLDPAFDGDGILTADFHGRGDFGQDLALDASGRIVAGGFTGSSTGTQFALMRANP